MRSEEDLGFYVFPVFSKINTARESMAAAIAVDMDAGTMAAGKKGGEEGRKPIRKPKPATMPRLTRWTGCSGGATCRRPRWKPIKNNSSREKPVSAEASKKNLVDDLFIS